MPVIKFETKEKYRYQNGFNCYLEWVSQVHSSIATLTC